MKRPTWRTRRGKLYEGHVHIGDDGKASIPLTKSLRGRKVKGTVELIEPEQEAQEATRIPTLEESLKWPVVREIPQELQGKSKMPDDILDSLSPELLNGKILPSDENSSRHMLAPMDEV